MEQSTSEAAALMTTWLMLTASQLPVLLVCLVGGALVIAKRGPSTPWALAGFALVLLVALVAPVSQVLIPQVAIRRAMPIQQVGWFSFALSVFWSVLHAVAYGLLLTAILTTRPRTPTLPVPPPLP